MLVGMDIIGHGDFAVTNHNGKTIFTYRCPSTNQIDFVKQIRVRNQSGLSHGKGKRKHKKRTDSPSRVLPEMGFSLPLKLSHAAYRPRLRNSGAVFSGTALCGPAI